MDESIETGIYISKLINDVNKDTKRDDDEEENDQ